MSDLATPRRVLVTGATGFVGSRVAARMAEDGCEVHAICRPESDRTRAPAVGRWHVYHGQAADVCAAVRAASPDLGVHIAAAVVGEHKPAQVAELVDCNITLGVQLADAMVTSGCRQLVNTGSFWQHYTGEERYSPVNLYAATKEAFEALLQYYVEAERFRVVTLKLADTYGPGDTRRKLFHLLGDAAATGGAFDMSPGDQMIDLVHIDDVVEAYWLAACRLSAGAVTGHERYMVRTGEQHRLKQVVALYEQVSGRSIDVRWGGKPYRSREVMTPYPGSVLPGWRPAVTLEGGIRQLVAGDGRVG